MMFRADVVVESQEGRPVAIIEVKATSGLNRRVAADIRRNLAMHFSLPPTQYFMVVSQDQGFLWSTDRGQDGLDSPDAEFSMVPVIHRYVAPTAEPGRLRGQELEYLVFQWLNELAWPTTLNDCDDLPLRQSPFADAIRHGRVLMEVRV